MRMKCRRIEVFQITWERITMRFSGSPTQLAKEACSRRVRCKRLLGAARWNKLLRVTRKYFVAQLAIKIGS